QVRRSRWASTEKSRKGLLRSRAVLRKRVARARSRVEALGLDVEDRPQAAVKRGVRQRRRDALAQCLCLRGECKRTVSAASATLEFAKQGEKTPGRRGIFDPVCPRDSLRERRLGLLPPVFEQERRTAESEGAGFDLRRTVAQRSLEFALGVRERSFR